MRGADITLDDLKRLTRRRGYIRAETDQRQVSLPEVLHREWAIVTAVREGLRTCDALVASPPVAGPNLAEEQGKALRQLLEFSDGVALFRGGAGTGIMPTAGLCRVDPFSPSSVACARFVDAA
ncbi:MAG TPA: hypothetical protein VK639_19535 [Terriglobales bacterium]|nr:hypothetical protein [Terriglobales bacterium]